MINLVGIFRKKIYNSLSELQQDLDPWLKQYNNFRSHAGKYCYGKTPMQTFKDSKHIANEKNIGNILEEGRQLDLAYN